MSTTITFITAGLSILVPLLFIRLLSQVNSPYPEPAAAQLRMKKGFIFGIILWSVLVWVSGTTGMIAYQEGDLFPRFLLPLFVPVLTFLSLLVVDPVRKFLDQMELPQLVGFQFWRIFGTVFFLVAFSGMGPRDLIASGFGDLFTGLLAITAYFLLIRKHAFSIQAVWAFMIVGVMDLLGILYILLFNYPIWSEAVPSSALAGSYPMILVVGIVAPIALIFHILTLRKLLLTHQSNQSPKS